MAEGYNPDIHHPKYEKPAIVIDSREFGLKPPVQQAVFDTRNKTGVVLVVGNTKKETGDLSEDLKKRFIERLKKLPDYEGSRLQEVIKSGKLEITKTNPVNFKKGQLELNVGSKYALYEKGGNLLYIVGLNGEKYFNVDRVRHGITGGGLEAGIKLFFGGEQKLENGFYNIYIQGRKIEIGSEEYNRIMLISCEDLIQFSKDLREEIKRREKEGY